MIQKEAREFHLEEYRLLKSEVAEVKRQAENMFKYSVVIAASIVAWLSTNKVDVGYSTFAWWVPTITTVGCGLLGFMYYMRVQTFGEYLRKLESRLGDNELGWEKILSTKKPIFKITYGSSWLVLLVFSLFVGSASIQESSEEPCHNKSIQPTAKAAAD